jgi:hypothetical protein
MRKFVCFRSNETQVMVNPDQVKLITREDRSIIIYLLNDILPRRYDFNTGSLAESVFDSLRRELAPL